VTYRRVLLYFTTGTGNAFRAATWVAESATAAGCEARIVRIEDAIPGREILLAPVSVGYLAVGRFFLAKLFFASRRCDGCGLCARACAHGAIEMRGADPRPYWTWRCESCMQCMAFCPRRAVEASHALAALVLALGAIVPLDVLFVRAASRALPALAPLIGSALVGTVLWSAYLLALIFSLYAVLAVAARVPLVLAVLEHTTLTRLYHRYREPGTRLHDIVPRTPPAPRPSSRAPTCRTS